MNKKELKNIGFKKTYDIFSGKKTWVIGKENTEICGDKVELPIIYYNIEKETCKTNRSEYCIIERKCRTKEEIILFIKSINFLFNLNIEIKCTKK